MSAIRFYCDEDSQNHALVRALRSRSVDVTSAGEAGLLGATDAPQLAWTNEHGRVLFTPNVGDFCRLHDQFVREGTPHTGIVVAEQGLSIGERLRRLLALRNALARILHGRHKAATVCG